MKHFRPLRPALLLGAVALSACGPSVSGSRDTATLEFLPLSYFESAAGTDVTTAHAEALELLDRLKQLQRRADLLRAPIGDAYDRIRAYHETTGRSR